MYPGPDNGKQGPDVALPFGEQGQEKMAIIGGCKLTLCSQRFLPSETRINKSFLVFSDVVGVEWLLPQTRSWVTGFN